jgi:hypothetical protein
MQQSISRVFTRLSARSNGEKLNWIKELWTELFNFLGESVNPFPVSNNPPPSVHLIWEKKGRSGQRGLGRAPVGNARVFFWWFSTGGVAGLRFMPNRAVAAGWLSALNVWLAPIRDILRSRRRAIKRRSCKS